MCCSKRKAEENGGFEKWLLNALDFQETVEPWIAVQDASALILETVPCRLSRDGEHRGAIARAGEWTRQGGEGEKSQDGSTGRGEDRQVADVQF